jgi:hypothetical protein
VADCGKYYLKAQADPKVGPSSAIVFIGVYKDGAAAALKKGMTRKGVNITVYRMGAAE